MNEDRNTDRSKKGSLANSIGREVAWASSCSASAKPSRISKPLRNLQVSKGKKQKKRKKKEPEFNIHIYFCIYKCKERERERPRVVDEEAHRSRGGVPPPSSPRRCSPLVLVLCFSWELRFTAYALCLCRIKPSPLQQHYCTLNCTNQVLFFF